MDQQPNMRLRWRQKLDHRSYLGDLHRRIQSYSKFRMLVFLFFSFLFYSFLFYPILFSLQLRHSSVLLFFRYIRKKESFRRHCMVVFFGKSVGMGAFACTRVVCRGKCNSQRRTMPIHSEAFVTRMREMGPSLYIGAKKIFSFTNRPAQGGPKQLHAARSLSCACASLPLLV